MAVPGFVPMPNFVVNHAYWVGPTGVPNYLPQQSTFGSLPLLKDASVEDFQFLFRWKLRICRSVFDFTDALKSACTKEIKRQTLLDINEYIKSGAGKTPGILQKEMIKMVSLHIFRYLPHSHDHKNIEALNFEPERPPYLEPSWIHLATVYELLARYIKSPNTVAKVAKRYIDRSFILNLLDLFDSEDRREGEWLETILRRIYEKFMVHRIFIWKEMSNIFYSYVYEKEKHNGISELLEIVECIFAGFRFTLKEKHKMFMMRVLIPLHKPKQIALYHQNLSHCITRFVEKDYELAEIVIRGLLKYWPLTDTVMEVLFLDELAELLKVTHAAEFQCCINLLFRQIARCLCNPHIMVAERALYLWSNVHIASLVAENRGMILPIIFGALEKNIRSHWNQVIRVLTVKLLRMFQEMDMELFEECQRQCKENIARSKELEEWRALAGKKLAEAAEKHMVTD